MRKLAREYQLHKKKTKLKKKSKQQKRKQSPSINRRTQNSGKITQGP